MNYAADAQLCLERIVTQLDFSVATKRQQTIFKQRLAAHFPRLWLKYTEVYGHQYDCFYHLYKLVNTLFEGFTKRKASLHKLDNTRINGHDWYRDEQQVGMACYVDLIGPQLRDLHAKIPYFKSLGVTYLHLMPLYACPQGDSDGGYAVSDYRVVNPALGDIKDLEALAEALRKEDISLVLDFVFNHTSDEHEWAVAAKQGDPVYQNYYYMFDDKSLPNQYERTLREIFPQVRRGNFTLEPNTQKWVWTTFNNFQWDLNYANPAVFNAITGEMLFLANIGCTALRLDALAFIWKEMGTDCENQPKAHALIQAFNACLQIAAPAVVFKSEAIVHPDEVVKYIHPEECQLSYNPLLMALLWNSLATRKTRLLTRSLQKRFDINPHCAWVNYVRCHDDIGWTFDDNVAWELGINPQHHRHFLNQFFTGRVPGSFANGVAFGENPTTGDCRVCGSLGSLVGLETAIDQNNSSAIETALKRIYLMYGITFSIGGIPLLYSGDELGLLNDYRYLEEAHKRHDARWVHRVAVDNEMVTNVMSDADATRDLVDSVRYRIFCDLKEMLSIRKQHAVFGRASTTIIASDNPHCFAFRRESEDGRCLTVIANFSEHQQLLPANLRAFINEEGSVDLLQKNGVSDKLHMQAYQLAWWLK